MLQDVFEDYYTEIATLRWVCLRILRRFYAVQQITLIRKIYADSAGVT